MSLDKTKHYYKNYKNVVRIIKIYNNRVKIDTIDLAVMCAFP